MKEIHVFGGCILLTCQVSMVRVQAVWEDWELAREIGDGGRQGSVRFAGKKSEDVASCLGGIKLFEGQRAWGDQRSCRPCLRESNVLRKGESKSHFQHHTISVLNTPLKISLSSFCCSPNTLEKCSGLIARQWGERGKGKSVLV